nr:MAG: replication associated protein [Cressdnaviricota sp.]
MPFRFQARYALLTYSQCGDELAPDRIVNCLSALAAECIIGRESHEDGGIHLHVFVDFGRKFRSGAVDVFDVDGFHPNISSSYGTPEKGYDYAIKDGDVVAGGLERPSGRGNGKADLVWSEIAAAETRDEFWELCRRLAPKTLLSSFPSLRAYAEWHYRPHIAEYESPVVGFIGGESDGRDAWFLQSGINAEKTGGRRQSLVMYGASQTGKTTWARSLGVHIYCVGLMSGSELLKAPDVEYAVFDDMRGGMKFFHSFKEWLGCQPHVSVKVLYKEPVVLPWGKVGIWLANDDPRDGMSPEDVNWLEANCTFIACNEKIVDWNV